MPQAEADSQVPAVTAVRALADHGITRAAVACGVFDGLHLGHLDVMRALRAAAARHAAAPVVLTFDPNPAAVVNADSPPDRLLSAAHQRRCFARLGIRAVVSIPFTPAFAARTREQFINEDVLGAPVQIAAICVGRNWRFGAGETGDTAYLHGRAARDGFELVAVAERRDRDGRVISATAVRRALAAGELDRVNALLGRPYALYGPVIAGKGLGRREVGFATANIAIAGRLVPPAGVYAARAVLDGGRLDGILYHGPAPTLRPRAGEAVEPVVELHLFDFDADVYGRELEVEFLAAIRGSRRFASSAALHEQISQDIDAAKRIHHERPPARCGTIEEPAYAI